MLPRPIAFGCRAKAALSRKKIVGLFNIRWLPTLRPYCLAVWRLSDPSRPAPVRTSPIDPPAWAQAVSLKPQLPTQSVIALHAHPTFRFASSLPACSRSLVCALALIRRAIILCAPGLLATIFLLLFVLLYAFVRQSSHCNTTASRYPSRSETLDAKKPFRRNAERLFQKLLNRHASDREDLAADVANLTGYRCRADTSSNRKASRNQWQRFSQW